MPHPCFSRPGFLSHLSCTTPPSLLVEPTPFVASSPIRPSPYHPRVARIWSGRLFLFGLDKDSEDGPATNIPTVDPIEIDKDPEELPVNNTDITADHYTENVDPSFSFRQDFPSANPIINVDEQHVTTDSHVIFNEEFQAFRAEMSKLKEEVIRLRGELVDVRKELAKTKAEDPEAYKSKHFMKGAICLLQDLVHKGLISPEEAMDPSIWH